MNAAVKIPSGAVENIERLGNRRLKEGLEDSFYVDFLDTGRVRMKAQVSQYEDSLGNIVGFGYTPYEFPDLDFQLTKRFGESTAGFVQPSPQDSRSNVYMLNSQSLAGFSLYNRTRASLSELLYPEELAKVYREAFKMLFVFAITDRWITVGTEVPTSVTRTFWTHGFTVNTLWSRISQVAFGVLGMLTICLLVSTWSRQCNLDGEPDSLGAGLGLLSRSSALARVLYNSEYHHPAELRRLLFQSTRRYWLHLVDGKGPQMDVIMERNDVGTDAHTSLPAVPGGSGLAPFISKPGWLLGGSKGVLHLLFLLFSALLVLLVALFLSSKRNNGTLSSIKYF